ncbi:c-type cytochrome [Rhodobacteraceae bacterium XHP0102]|nr:c-type cytochrome [Rhodobacteraceae bacterium XHP0102]
MKKSAIIAAVAGLCAATSAFADGHGASGDAAAGERVFNQCVACHVVANDAGDVLAGRNGRTGPNLYGTAGRPVASVEGFRYSPSITQVGEAGTVWTEEAFVAYVLDPTAYLREATGDSRARSAMAFRVRSEEDAKNVYAYLASLSAE